MEIRKLQKYGQNKFPLNLPKTYIELLGWKPGDSISIDARIESNKENNHVILKKVI